MGLLIIDLSRHLQFIQPFICYIMYYTLYKHDIIIKYNIEEYNTISNFIFQQSYQCRMLFFINHKYYLITQK